jgi:hypothetical protein
LRLGTAPFFPEEARRTGVEDFFADAAFATAGLGFLTRKMARTN